MPEISRRTILSMLGSDFAHFVELPLAGASGGILIAWRLGLGAAVTTRVDNYCLSVKFCLGNEQPWWLTCVYGPQGDDNKVLFLQELRDVRAACQGPWIVLGDYSLIYKDEDKNNGNLNQALMGRFHRFINDLGLKELPLHGQKFTWSNQQDSLTLVRLDRVFCSVDWEHLFTATDRSDHCPLLLDLHDNKPGKARFHFESFWTMMEGFQEAVEDAWSSIPRSLLDPPALCGEDPTNSTDSN